MVMYVKKQLIEGTPQFRDGFLREWREQVTKAVVQLFNVSKQLEKDVFGEKSYFKKVEEGTEVVIANALRDGEGQYHFDSHGARDDAAKRIAKDGSINSSHSSSDESAGDDDTANDDNVDGDKVVEDDEIVEE